MPMQMSPVSIVITTVIVLVMLGLFAQALRKADNRSSWASYLVSLGIFGTFLGITVALWNFDARSVEESVPDLLSGMQIAFISSALGILLSLILRWQSVTGTVAGADEGKTADDIFMVLKGHTSLLESVKTALVGDGDTTLITQLKLLRGESKDGAERIREALDHFAKTLAENNSKAFIEALEGAVREFNEKISEQCGENFKQLNVAVGQLLTWQEQYKEQLEEMMLAFEEIKTSFQDASSLIGDVATQTEALATVSERQAQWLEAQKTAQTELEARLVAFADMADKAQSAFPLINQNLKEITEGMKRTVHDTLEAVEGAIAGLESGVAETQKQVIALTENLGTEVKTSVTSFQQQSLEANARHQQRLEESVEEFDRMLGEELSKSLQSLGNQLATLSSKFVEDYQPLTESLQRVVQLSRRIQP
jgi:uncharacterized phage infection (PIP) family protein YhgE